MLMLYYNINIYNSYRDIYDLIYISEKQDDRGTAQRSGKSSNREGTCELFGYGCSGWHVCPYSIAEKD